MIKQFLFIFTILFFNNALASEQNQNNQIATCEASLESVLKYSYQLSRLPEHIWQNPHETAFDLIEKISQCDAPEKFTVVPTTPDTIKNASDVINWIAQNKNLIAEDKIVLKILCNEAYADEKKEPQLRLWQYYSRLAGVIYKNFLLPPTP